MEAHQLRRAARDVAVAAEIAVDLPGESVNSQQRGSETRYAELARERLVGDDGAGVSDDAFAEKAGENENQSVIEGIGVETALVLNLRQQMRRPLDGAGDQMREQADEERVVEERLGRFHLFPVDVDDVRKLLERVERNAGRQGHLQQRDGGLRQAQSMGQGREGIDEEVEVFEVAEEPEVDANGNREEKTAFFGIRGTADEARAEEIDNGRGENEAQKPDIPPAIKDVTGDQKQHVLAFPVQPPVQKNDEDEKESEGWSVEKQAVCRLTFATPAATGTNCTRLRRYCGFGDNSDRRSVRSGRREIGGRSDRRAPRRSGESAPRGSFYRALPIWNPAPGA